MGADQSDRYGGFGELLRRYRLAAGLSQEELGERSRLTARAISDMERGRTARPYRRSVRSLADALELREPERTLLEQASRLVLAGSAAPAASAAQSRPARPAITEPGQDVPRQLPPAVAGFTGRNVELTALTGLLGRRGERSPALVISAIAGTAGVGKTALAVQWAHRIAQRFPDGQLYVNLRGYDPREPVPATDALAGFLRALGVPGQQIPDEPDERARLYRSRLAGRRVLVLLDNARDGEQVRPLLPGDPGCVAVVTSRDALAGLVAADGARRLDLDVLLPADAVGLLRALIGRPADEDPAATTELAGLCARLPLALRIAAELAAARPATPLRDLVAELAAGRLDALNAGEELADVRAVFSWSLRQLSRDVARAFALLGLHPGADLDVYAAAALTGTTPARARLALSRLHRTGLIQASGRGRYRMHDLLRAYAREQAVAAEQEGAAGTDVSCEQALTQLFDYYLAAAAAAAEVLFPAEPHQRARTTTAAAVTPEMPGEAEARAWLDAERANLVAVVVSSAGHGWPQPATMMARTLFRYLMTGSHLPEAHTIYDHALNAARRSGDLAAEAEALNGLGGIEMVKGHFADAAGHYRDALESYRRCGDRPGEARVLHNLGVTEHYVHNHGAAASHYRQAIAAYDDAGDRLGAAVALCGLAGVETEMDSLDQASDHLQRALPVFRDEKDQAREANALAQLGDLSLRRDQLAQAADFHEQALAMFRRIDHPGGVAAGLSSLGEVSVRRGDYQQAIGYLRQALAQFRQAGNQHGEAATIFSLAAALHGAGQPAAARTELEAALLLASETGNTYQQASAHRDLAESYCSAGEDEQARHHWQQAVDLYTQLGAPEADQLRSQPIPRSG